MWFKCLNNSTVIFGQIFFIIFLNAVNGQHSAFDYNLYKEVLNPEECKTQLDYITNQNGLLKGQFLDAGVRTPRGILINNFRDMGNYYQCLNINEQHRDMTFEGKYCVTEVTISKNMEAASTQIFEKDFLWDFLKSANRNSTPKRKVPNYEPDKEYFETGLGNARVSFLQSQEIQHLELAFCIPKVCTVQQFLNAFTNDTSIISDISEKFCRLLNDKPWVVADYVAIVIFSLIGVLTICSTYYDLHQSVVQKKDPTEADKLYTTFSVYTNTRKFLTFRPDTNIINCVEGIRALSMLWIIIIHTFYTQTTFLPANPIDIREHVKSFWSLLFTSGYIAVDNFFMLTGLLLVYTQTSKVSRLTFLKNLHIFYLNRFLRLFPVLATGILLQASFQNHITDGPYWDIVAKSTDDCRQYWWTTLLYLRNITKSGYFCLVHSWYLAVDMQLYILSPIVLVWVLGGNKKSAWFVLVGSLLAVLTSTSVYNFLMEFQSSFYAMSRTQEDLIFFNWYYYINTFPRSSPFFVGMLFGYLLHTCRNRKIRMSKVMVVFFWLLATATLLMVILSTHFVIQPDWDNQIVDSILNSYMRPAWAASIAWMIFACLHGYGGPINWFLSLTIFKFLGRLSYAMYIVHLPIIYIMNATVISPTYFSIEFTFHRFIVDLNLTILLSLIITIFIDIPFSGLFGMLLKGLRERTNSKKDVNSSPPKPDAEVAAKSH